MDGRKRSGYVKVNSNGHLRRGFCTCFQDSEAEVYGYSTWDDVKSNSMLSAVCCNDKRSQRVFDSEEEARLYHTSKYDSGLPFGLNLVIPFVDLIISIRTNLPNYEAIRECETKPSYIFHWYQISVVVRCAVD